MSDLDEQPAGTTPPADPVVRAISLSDVNEAKEYAISGMHQFMDWFLAVCTQPAA